MGNAYLLITDGAQWRRVPLISFWESANQMYWSHSQEQGSCGQRRVNCFGAVLDIEFGLDKITSIRDVEIVARFAGSRIHLHPEIGHLTLFHPIRLPSWRILADFAGGAILTFLPQHIK